MQKCRNDRGVNREGGLQLQSTTLEGRIAGGDVGWVGGFGCCGLRMHAAPPPTLPTTQRPRPWEGDTGENPKPTDRESESESEGESGRQKERKKERVYIGVVDHRRLRVDVLRYGVRYI